MIYREGFGDTPWFVQQSLSLFAVTVVEGAFIWLVYGFTRAFSSFSERIISLTGILQWEHKNDGSIEAWHAPDGARKRTDKTYLGRIGKRRFAEWLAEPSDKRPAIIAEWIAEKRRQKGIAAA